MPELGHLRTFVAVAEERNFTRAARRLHVAQQAVSKSIATLEAQLGVALVRRTTREVTLTPAGEALLRSGAAALRGVDAAFAEATAYGRAQAGLIRVGVTPGVGTALHPTLVEALTTGAAHVRVVLRELRPGEATDLLSRSELDLVVSRTRLVDGDFDRVALPSTPAIVLVGAGHRLAGRGRIAVADLDGQRVQLWNGAGHPYTDELVHRLALLGVAVQITIARVVVSSGPPDLAADELAIRPVGWPSPAGGALEIGPPGLRLPLLLTWKAGSIDPAVRRLREHFPPDPGVPAARKR